MSSSIQVPAYSGKKVVAVEAQGSLCALAWRSDANGRAGGGQRGAVTVFSKASRRRMLRKLARLDMRKPVFVTLTYPADYPDAQTAKQNLRAFFERIRRRIPEASAVWRLELQKRGAPHFHILFFGLPYVSHATIRDWWGSIISVIDSEPLFVRVEMIRSKRGAMYYASKYMSKPTKSARSVPAQPGFFNHDAYPHAFVTDGRSAVNRQRFLSLTPEPPAVGRWWGVFNGPRLPFAARYAVAVRVEGARMFHDCKRLMRRHFDGMNARRGKGGTVFADGSYTLAAALVRLLLQDCSDEWYAGDLIALE